MILARGPHRRRHRNDSAQHALGAGGLRGRGTAGFVPGGCGIAAGLRLAALAWGAVLLAAAAAVHCGLALAGGLPSGRSRIAALLVAALVGAGGVVVGGQRGLALLVVGHGGFWLYEKHALGSRLPAAYLALRRQVTFATCMLLALTMFVSDAAGLS